MRKFLVFCLLGLSSCFTQAQCRISAAAEGALTLDFFKLRFDEGNRISNRPALSGAWGFNLRGIYSNQLFWEALVQRKYFSQVIDFSEYPEINTSENIFNAWLFSLGSGRAFILSPDKLQVLLSVGYVFGVNSNAIDGPEIGGGSSFSQNDGIDYEYNYISDPTLESRFHMAYLNAGVEYKVMERLWLGFRLSYTTGFSRLLNQDVTYSISNSAVYRARRSSDGDFLGICFGLRIPVGNSNGKEQP
jgi:hypothetical protein